MTKVAICEEGSFQLRPSVEAELYRRLGRPAQAAKYDRFTQSWREVTNLDEEDSDYLRFFEEGRIGERFFFLWDVPRDNPHLLALVKEELASGVPQRCALKIVEVPDDVVWSVQHDEYDDGEWIEEAHRTWR